MCTFSDLSQPRLLSFSERLVGKAFVRYDDYWKCLMTMICHVIFACLAHVSLTYISLSVHPSVHLSVRELHFVCAITHHKCGLQSLNLHQTCILGYSLLVLKMEVIERDLHGHLAIILTPETSFSIALAYWSRSAKGCYMSQMCSCYLLF